MGLRCLHQIYVANERSSIFYGFTNSGNLGQNDNTTLQAKISSYFFSHQTKVSRINVQLMSLILIWASTKIHRKLM